jgi:hypothetical protein
MKRAVIEQEEMEARGVGSSEMLQEEVKALRIEGGQFQKEALPGHWFHGAIEIPALKAIGGRHDGLAPAGGNPMTHDGQEPAAALILRPHTTVQVPVLASSVDGRQELSRGLCQISPQEGVVAAVISLGVLIYAAANEVRRTRVRAV